MKKFCLKRIWFIAVFAIFQQHSLLAVTPPGSFVLVSNANIADISLYETAIANADLENFRYQNIRCLIIFDTGIQFELLSAAELAATGQSINVTAYKTTDNPNYIAPVFHLNTDGSLSAAYAKATGKPKSMLNTN